MSDYDLATERLLLQIAKERIAALSDQSNRGMSHIPAGSRMAGWLDGTKIGYVTIPESQDSARVTDSAAFTAWAQQNWPGQCTDVIRPEYLSDGKVVALVKERYPEMITQVVRRQFADEVLESVLNVGGWHDEDGVKQDVPGVERKRGGAALTPTALLDKDVKVAAKNPQAPLPSVMARALGRAVLALPAAGTVTVTPDGWDEGDDTDG